MQRYYYFFYIAILITSNSSLAETITVGGNNSDFANLQDAIDYAATLENDPPKLVSNVSTCQPFLSNRIYSFSGTNWINDIDIGDQFSTDGIVWYEVTNVISDNEIIVNRNNEVSSGTCFSGHQVVEVNTIELRSGSYKGPFNFENINFLRIKGIGPKESVVIHTFDEIVDPTSPGGANVGIPIENIQGPGSIYFENLVLSNPNYGPVITHTPNNSDTTNLDLYFDNVDMLSNIGDIMFDLNLSLGNVYINNTYGVVSIDGIGGIFKTLNIKDSKIVSLWDSDLNSTILSGVKSKALHFDTINDSVIENSSIVMMNLIPANGGADHSAIEFWNSSQDSKLTIINSDITAISDTASAINIVHNGIVDIINSRIVGKGLNAYDIRIGENGIVNLYCSGNPTFIMDPNSEIHNHQNAHELCP